MDFIIQMGQQLSDESTLSPVLSQLQQRFEVLPHPAYAATPSLKLLNEKQTNTKYILRIKVTNNQQEGEYLQQQINKKLANKTNLTTRLQHFYIEEVEGYCGKLIKYYLLFNVGPNETALTARTSLDLHNGLDNLVNGLLWLKQLGVRHGNISASNIYVLDGLLTLSDPEIAPQAVEASLRYPSPEKLLKIRNEIEDYDVYASDLFSIALIVLELSRNTRLERIYKKNYSFINIEALIQEIDKCPSKNLQMQLRYLLLCSESNRKIYLQQQKKSFSKVMAGFKNRPVKSQNNIGEGKTRNIGIRRANNAIIYERKDINQVPIQNVGRDHKIQFKQVAIHTPIHTPINTPIHTNYKMPVIKEATSHFKGNTESQRPKSNSKINFNYVDNRLGINQISKNIPIHKPSTYQPINYDPIRIALPTLPLSSLSNGTIKPLTEHKNEQHDHFKPSLSDKLRKYYQNMPTFNKYEPTTTTSNSYIYRQYKQPEMKLNIPYIPSQKLSTHYSEEGSLPSNGNHLPFEMKHQISHPKIKVLEASGAEYLPVVPKESQSIRFSDGASFQKQPQQIENHFAMSDIVNHSEINLPHSCQPTFLKRQCSHLEDSLLQQMNLCVETASQAINETKYAVAMSPNLPKQDKQAEVPLPTNNLSQSQQVRSSLTEEAEENISTLIIHGTQLETVSNLAIPEESQEQSYDSTSVQRKGQFCEQYYENGGIYKGVLVNGLRNGEGTFYYKDGGYYVGNWKDNKMNGYGKLYYESDKLAYEGQWYRDEFHGRGKIYNDSPELLLQNFNYQSFEDEDRYWQCYQGDISHDMKEGHGKLTLSNGQIYTGEFKNDKPNGRGHFSSKDNKVIHGIWNQGKMIKEI